MGTSKNYPWRAVDGQLNQWAAWGFGQFRTLVSIFFEMPLWASSLS